MPAPLIISLNKEGIDAMLTLEYCPICSTTTDKAQQVFSSNSSFTGEPFESRLIECSSCNHVFLSPQPNWEELEQFYSSEYHCYQDAEEPTLPKGNTFSEREFCHIPILPDKRFLDVGCGIGNLVATMSLLGMESEGVEPSLAAAEKAQSLGRKVFCGTLHEARYSNDTFDAMAMIHVLEHVADPIALLQECYRILKPNGVLTVGVPNFDSLVFRYVGQHWIGLQLPTHLHHFRSSSLCESAYKANFTVAKIFTESLVPHVEGELAKWIRLKFFIPQRLLLKTQVIRPWARYMASRGNKTGKGEAIVVQMCKK